MGSYIHDGQISMPVVLIPIPLLRLPERNKLPGGVTIRTKSVQLELEENNFCYLLAKQL